MPSLGKGVPFGEGRSDFDKVTQRLYALNSTAERIIEREISCSRQISDIQLAVWKLTVLIEKNKL